MLVRYFHSPLSALYFGVMLAKCRKINHTRKSANLRIKIKIKIQVYSFCQCCAKLGHT